jgi:hypothetical protein
VVPVTSRGGDVNPGFNLPQFIQFLAQIAGRGGADLGAADLGRGGVGGVADSGQGGGTAYA